MYQNFIHIFFKEYFKDLKKLTPQSTQIFCFIYFLNLLLSKFKFIVIIPTLKQLLFNLTVYIIMKIFFKSLLYTVFCWSRHRRITIFTKKTKNKPNNNKKKKTLG